MTTRITLKSAAPQIYKALINLDTAVRERIDPALAELIRIRASQINGCAYCLHMHTTDAREAGESNDRLALVSLWDDSPQFFTEPEQAVLALTEAVTTLPHGGVPDAVYARVALHFDEQEIAHLIGLIFTINVWNRINVATAVTP